MKLKLTMPTQVVIDARMAVINALRPFGDQLSPPDQLAVVAYLIGQLIGLQDQRVMTSAMAMDIVIANIEAGNQALVDGLINAPGGHA